MESLKKLSSQVQSKNYRKHHGRMNLINSDNFEAEKKCENIALMLADRETNWDDQQKMKVNLQSTENIENGRKTKDYIKTMLADCKS